MNNINEEYCILEKIKHVGIVGQEQWSARELYPILGYCSWDRFKIPLNKAMIDMLNNNFDLEDHFTRLIKINKDDYILDRYACYLIAKHSNSYSKDLIDAEAYFAIKIWRDYKKHNSEGSIAI